MSWGHPDYGPAYGFGQAGKGPVRPNLIAGPSNLGDAAWVYTNSDPAQNVIAAPDTTVTADRWTRRSVAAAYALQTIVKPAAATRYRFSAFARRNVGNFLPLLLQGASYANRAYSVLNLATGAVHAAAATVGGFSAASSSIAAFDADWWWWELVATSDASASVKVGFGVNSNGGFIDQIDTAANSSGYVWGMALRQT